LIAVLTGLRRLWVITDAGWRLGGVKNKQPSAYLMRWLMVRRIFSLFVRALYRYVLGTEAEAGRN
jgi:hypothetical protein